MNEDLPNPERSRAKFSINLISSLIFLMLSSWMLFADFTFNAPVLAQSSGSLLIFFLFISIWILGAIILAVLPKRFSISIFILFMIRSSYGWPISEFTNAMTACRITDVMLVAVSIIYLLYSVRNQSALAARPWIRWQHSVGLAGCWIVAGILAIPMTFFGLSNAAEAIVGDYVQFTPKGINFKEKVFEKDGRRVHLIGMTHIGEASFYKVLNQNISRKIDGKRLVLTEGVSDSQKLLPESFANGETYQRLAKRFGLEMQGKQEPKTSTEEAAALWTKKGVHFENGDIDISELSEEHLATLVATLEMVDEVSKGNFFPTMPEGITEESIFKMMSEALIKERNDHLMSIYESKKADFREVYIPWGAAHLAELETQLLGLGYLPVDETSRLGIDFWKAFR